MKKFVVGSLIAITGGFCGVAFGSICFTQILIDEKHNDTLKKLLVLGYENDPERFNKLFTEIMLEHVAEKVKETMGEEDHEK